METTPFELWVVKGPRKFSLLFVCLLRRGDVSWISILSLNWWAENSASFTEDGPVQYPVENSEELVSDEEPTSEE